VQRVTIVSLASLLLFACQPKPAQPSAGFDYKKLTSIPSEQACGQCHKQVFEEHQANLHAQAWTDPVYIMSARKKGVMISHCKSCHSMEPILFDDYSIDYGYRPVLRDYNHNDGVGCVSCHLRPDGTVAARTTSDAPCKPVKDKRILTTEYCGSCHNPTHDVVYEFYTSQAYKQGATCHTCHMPEVERLGADGKKKVGFSHKFEGGNSPSFVKKALKVEIKLEGRKVHATLTNLSSHKLPGEVPTRIIKFKVATYDKDGNNLFSEYQQIKRPGKTEIGFRDNRLLPDEVRTLTQEFPAGAVLSDWP
jgi:nitrate/TMAO reductase-like tetraheme cytochrome c subunit